MLITINSNFHFSNRCKRHWKMAVYDLIADKLVQQLEKEKRVVDISNRFVHIRTNWQKVDFADKIWQQSNIRADVPFRIAKSNERSCELRQLGNQFFSLKNKDYVKALDLYNQSICAAENGSEILAIGYANRSAIYFEWKKYELCLDNIKLAREFGYPERLVAKLDKRESECNKLLNDDGETSGDEDDNDNVMLAPKLTYPPHPTVPFIANCLEMKESDTLGRYIVSNVDLKVGQVIAIEDGFCTLTLPCVRYQRCANCLQECEFSLIPCDQCTSTMFCSETCKTDAFHSFHKYECPMIDFMHKMFNSIQLSAIRVSLCALTSFDSITDLMQFVNDPQNTSVNAFTLDYTREPMPKSELYKPIHTLETNQDKRSTAELFQRAVVTAVIRRALLDTTTLSELLPDNDELNLLTELLFRHLQTASTNFHRLETLANTVDPNNLDDVSYGSGAYGFCSLINHACSPNIVRLPIGRRISVFVLRPIKAGEQLLDNYG